MTASMRALAMAGWDANARVPNRSSPCGLVVQQISTYFNVEAGSLLLIDETTGDLDFVMTIEGGEEMRAPYANWKVIDALSFSLNEAVVRLTEHGEWPYGIEAPPRVDPSCKGR